MKDLEEVRENPVGEMIYKCPHCDFEGIKRSVSHHNGHMHSDD